MVAESVREVGMAEQSYSKRLIECWGSGDWASRKSVSILSEETCLWRMDDCEVR